MRGRNLASEFAPGANLELPPVVFQKPGGYMLLGTLARPQANRARNKVGGTLRSLMGLTHMNPDSLGVVSRKPTRVAEVFDDGGGGRMRASTMNK
eukprot:3239851-Pyramimonas_sp.AAC.1